MRGLSGRCACLVLLAGLGLACTTETQEPQPVALAKARSSLAADFADLDVAAICQLTSSCCSAMGYANNLTNCTTIISAVKGMSGELEGVSTPVVTGPNVVYNDPAATQCLAGISAMGCGNVSAGSYGATLQACYSVFTGTLPAGSGCAVSLECAPGNFCDAGTCAPLRALGDPCAASEECGYRGNGAACESGICVGALPDGASCLSGVECTSGLCDGTCTTVTSTPFTPTFCDDLAGHEFFDARVVPTPTEAAAGATAAPYGGWSGTTSIVSLALSQFEVAGVTAGGATVTVRFGVGIVPGSDPVQSGTSTNGCVGTPCFRGGVGTVTIGATLPGGYCYNVFMFDNVRYRITAWDPVTRVLAVQFNPIMTTCVGNGNVNVPKVDGRFKVVLP